jgi:hypothetical protein
VHVQVKRDGLRRSVLAAYERLIGLELADVSIDGCIGKARAASCRGGPVGCGDETELASF